MGTFLVTGASYGMGHAVATRLLERENLVISLSRTNPMFDAGATHRWYPFNLGKAGVKNLHVARMQKDVVAFSGICINVAVQEREKSQWSRQQIEKHLNVNCLGHAQLFMQMYEHGLVGPRCSIVVLDSFLGDSGSDWAVAYAMSKAALKAFFKSVYKRYSEKLDLSVYFVQPGRVETPGNPVRELADGEPGFQKPEGVAEVITDLLENPKQEQKSIDLFKDT